MWYFQFSYTSIIFKVESFCLIFILHCTIVCTSVLITFIKCSALMSSLQLTCFTSWLYLSLYIYICMCVCACVRACVCVCVCGRLFLQCTSSIPSFSVYFLPPIRSDRLSPIAQHTTPYQSNQWELREERRKALYYVIFKLPNYPPCLFAVLSKYFSRSLSRSPAKIRTQSIGWY